MLTQDTPRRRLGRLLANKRTEVGMTQEDAARKLSARLGEHVNRGYIAAAETQWKMWPSIERLMALVDIYEMSQAGRLLRSSSPCFTALRHTIGSVFSVWCERTSRKISRRRLAWDPSSMRWSTSGYSFSGSTGYG